MSQMSVNIPYNILLIEFRLKHAQMHSWMGFCLYVAAGVFIQDLRSEQKNLQSLTHLEFLISAMKAVGRKHMIAQNFVAQLELDIETSGIRDQNDGSYQSLVNSTKPRPFYGYFPEEDDIIVAGKTSPQREVLLKAAYQSPLLGILPSERIVSKPQDGFNSPVTATPSILSLSSTEDGASGRRRIVTDTGVLNAVYDLRCGYGILPSRGRKSRPQDSRNVPGSNNFDLGMPESAEPSTASFDPDGFQSGLWSPSNLHNDQGSPQTMNSPSSSGPGSAKTSAWVSPSSRLFDIENGDNQASANDANANTPVAMAADGLLDMRSYLGSSQYPYKDDLNKDNQSKIDIAQNYPYLNDANSTEKSNEWIFDPLLTQNLCTLQSGHPDGSRLFQN